MGRQVQRCLSYASLGFRDAGKRIRKPVTPGAPGDWSEAAKAGVRDRMERLRRERAPPKRDTGSAARPSPITWIPG